MGRKREGYKDCPELASWPDAFNALKVVIKSSRKKKKVVFIDEISWMDTPKSNFVSALEHFWNSWCSARKDVLLIICASATSWIINKVIKDRGGLHNRVNTQIYLMPFTLKESGGDPVFGSHSLNSGVHRAWSGLAFERVCLQHVGQIKAALGIAGVMTKQCAWRSDQKNLGPGERGAQIDLLIDRRDDTINICEMKWASEPYVIDKDYDEKLRNKVAAFIRETGTRKSILISMVTTYGVKENMYSDAVQSQVVMDDLFAQKLFFAKSLQISGI